MRKIIAVTRSGQEYMYSRSSAHAVSEACASVICSFLNRTGYKLKTGEKWHIYTVDKYAFESCSASFQQFTIRNNRILETR